MTTSRRLFASGFLFVALPIAACNDDQTPAAPVASSGSVPTATQPAGPAVPSGNRPPLASFGVRPEPDRNGKGVIRGKSPFTVHFNMCASSDPDGDEVLYTHDFDGDGVDERKGFGGDDCRRSFIYIFTATIKSQRFEPRQCLTDVDARTGERLHPKQCRSWVVEVLKRK